VPRPVLAALLAAVLGAGCGDVGGPVPGAPAHHRERGFANPGATHVPASAWVRTRFFVARIWSSTFTPRTIELLRVANDGAALRDNRTEPTVTWVGHATLLVQLDDVNVLTDPQWSNQASPVSFGGPRRVTAPGLRFEDLPHYDHLDVATVRRLAAGHRPRFLVPLRLKTWFAHLGITDVEEMDWWQRRTEHGLTITCLPAQHFSGRGLWDRNRRLWSGWAIAGRHRRLFFAGDTRLRRRVQRDRPARGPFDLAAVPIGTYLPPIIMRASHTTPRAPSISPTSPSTSRRGAWPPTPSGVGWAPSECGFSSSARLGAGERFGYIASSRRPLR